MISNKMFVCFVTLSLAIVSKSQLFDDKYDGISHAEIGDYPALNAPNCGIAKMKGIPKTRIINGERAQEGEFPWMASLHYEDKSKPETYFCGGVLIGDLWVLTVKHCIKEYKICIKFVPKIDFISIYLKSGNRSREE